MKIPDEWAFADDHDFILESCQTCDCCLDLWSNDDITLVGNEMGDVNCYCPKCLPLVEEDFRKWKIEEIGDAVVDMAFGDPMPACRPMEFRIL